MPTKIISSIFVGFEAAAKRTETNVTLRVANNYDTVSLLSAHVAQLT
jgi:hypothetical protein